MSRGFQTAVVIGGWWGFVEVTLTYVTGYAPASEVAEIFFVPVLASLLYHLALRAAFRVRPYRVFELLTTAGLLLPPLVFMGRGHFRLVPLNLAAGLPPVLLCFVLVLLEARRPSDRGWLTPGRMVSVVAIYLGAALAFAIRSDRNAAITTAMILTAAAWCLALAVVAAATLALTRRFVRAAQFAVVMAFAIALAWQRGSAPPTYETADGGPVVPSPTRPGAPNVLLIVMDTVRADHLDLYGYPRPTFPLTSQYLKSGLVFDRATSSGTFSLTSHSSLFTGLIPSAHGAYPVFRAGASYGRVWPDIVTLASFLKGRGYRTAGVSANDIFLAEWTGLQKGFDSFSASSRRRLRFPALATELRRSLIPRNWLGGRLTPNTTWKASEITDAALGLAGQGPEPFFLFLNYFDVHDPRVLTGSPAWIVPRSSLPIDAYDSRIAYLDSEIARLLRSLEQRGQLDRTLVILAADHGEYFFERGLRGHPPSTYEQSIHVPLALRLPGVVGAGRSARRTGLHEVYRMVEDIVKQRSLDWLREIDLSPRILNEAWSRNDYERTVPPDGRPSTSVVFSGNLKLIHRLNGLSELFDLESDPGEQRNLMASEDPRIVTARAQMLKEVTLRAVRGPGPAPRLSEDAKERLRALGYLR